MNSTTKIGNVTWEKINIGSKSQHETTVFRTEDGERLCLVQPDASPYRQELLRDFAGHQCRVVGSRKGSRFIVESIEALDA